MRGKQSLETAAVVLAVVGLVTFARTRDVAHAEPAHAPAGAPSTTNAAGAQSQTSSSFHTNVLEDAEKNTAFRRVLFTGKREQLVVMSLPPGTDIGEEVHPHAEQVFYVVSGSGKAVVDGKATKLRAGDVLVVTPGVRHDVVNEGSAPLQLFTMYAPPYHIPGRVHATKQDAERDTADEAFGRRVR